MGRGESFQLWELRSSRLFAASASLGEDDQHTFPLPSRSAVQTRLICGPKFFFEGGLGIGGCACSATWPRILNKDPPVKWLVGIKPHLNDVHQTFPGVSKVGTRGSPMKIPALSKDRAEVASARSMTQVRVLVRQAEVADLRCSAYCELDPFPGLWEIGVFEGSLRQGSVLS